MDLNSSKIPIIAAIGVGAAILGYAVGSSGLLQNKKEEKRKTVLVSGCYDLLHTGHVKFFKDAAKLGDLYVSVGSDACVAKLKKAPMFEENERVYFVNAIKHVKEAYVCKGMGMMDWCDALEHPENYPLGKLPDIFYVNEDGDHRDEHGVSAKEEACKQYGVEYYVDKRIPEEGLKAHSSTSIKAGLKK